MLFFALARTWVMMVIFPFHHWRLSWRASSCSLARLYIRTHLSPLLRHSRDRARYGITVVITVYNNHVRTCVIVVIAVYDKRWVYYYHTATHTWVYRRLLRLPFLSIKSHVILVVRSKLWHVGLRRGAAGARAKMYHNFQFFLTARAPNSEYIALTTPRVFSSTNCWWWANAFIQGCRYPLYPPPDGFSHNLPTHIQFNVYTIYACIHLYCRYSDVYSAISYNSLHFNHKSWFYKICELL